MSLWLKQTKKPIPKIEQALKSGERGIRTLGTVTRTHDFESSPFDHSGISPLQT